MKMQTKKENPHRHWGNQALENPLSQKLLEDILKNYCDTFQDGPYIPEQIRFASWLFVKIAPMYGDNLLTERLFVNLTKKLKQILNDQDYIDSFDKEEPIRVAIENQINDLAFAFRRIKNG